MIDTLFFYLSKLLWVLVSPPSLLLLTMMAGMACLLLQRQRLATWLFGLATGSLLFIAVFPVGSWLLYPLEARFPPNPPLPDEVTGIVLLGGSVKALESHAWGQVELNEAAERNVALVDLANRYPQARLVMTGGSGTLRDQAYREADVARDLFRILGLDPDRIVFERDSRNTVENARFSRELLQPRPGETWLLITSAFHMPRAVGVFCKADWPVLPWPVDHQTSRATLWRLEWSPGGNLVALNKAIHEWLGLFSYYLTGRSSAPLPAGCLPRE